MVKLVHTRMGTLDAKREKGPSGIEYIFYRTAPTLVTDKKDEAFFLSKDHDGAFRKLEKTDFLVEKVKEAVSKMTGKKVLVPASTLPNKYRKQFTAAEAKALNKNQQTELLNFLGSKNVPRYEKDRVAMILKLQEEVDYEA